MKLLTFLFLFLISTISVAQSFRAVFLNPNVYRTRIDLTANRLIDDEWKTVYNDTYVIKVSDLGYLDYKVIKEDENGYTIIKILPKVKLTTETLPGSKKMINVVRHTEEKQLKSDNDNAYNYYFSIKKDGFKPLSKTLLSNKIVGIPLVHPFKLRPKKGIEGWNLEGEFTLSYNFGYRVKLGTNHFNQNFISFVPYGLGVGSSKYFIENSDGTLSEKKDAYAITYYQGGILLTLQKINFGVFVGVDGMIDKRNNWFYQGKPWFSFGLGYKFKED